MKRGVIAVLALSLTLGGCGGSDGGANTTSPSSSAPSPSGSPSASGGSPGTGGAPTAPGEGEAAKAAQKLSSCMRKQGVTQPEPGPSSTLSPQERAKIRAALRSCAKSMSRTTP